MTFTVEHKLTLVNLLCQAYVFLFLILSVAILLHVTLPDVCAGDHNTLYHLKLLTYFIFLNVGGNYICVWYKSRLSIVKPERAKLKLGPLFSPHSTIYSSQDFTGTLASAATLSADAYNSKYSMWNGNYNSKEYWTNNGLISGREHQNCLAYADYFYKDQNRSNICNNSGYIVDSGFTYSNNLDRYFYDFSQEHTVKEADSESALGSEVTKEPTVYTAAWSKCKDCSVAVPPRAKHCPLCRHCILKRDHHCFFMGCCIGFHNQRFFVIFCLYAAVGEIYSSAVTLLYLRRNFEASYTWGCLAYLLPVVLFIWLMGGTSGFNVGMIIFLYWSMMTALFCCYFFIFQIFLVYRGQTKYECLKGIKTYQRTVWKNITSVFGRYWLIGFIIPAPFLGYV